MMIKKTMFTHRPHVTHTRSVYIQLMKLQSIADDVTMTRQLLHDRMNNDI